MKNQSKAFQSHEIAPHIAAAFGQVPHTETRLARLAMDHAIKILLAAQPTTLDLTDPDNGIPYALNLALQGTQPEEVKTACSLLRMCLHVIERGKSVENERIFITLMLAGLAGYVPDRNRRAAKQKRPSRRKEDDELDQGLKEALKANPEGSWMDLAAWLEGERIVKKYDGATLTFIDNEIEKTIVIRTFQNRISEVKAKAKKK